MTTANTIDQLTLSQQRPHHNVAPSANGGRKLGVRYRLVESPVGWIQVAGTDRGVVAVRLGDDPAALEAGSRNEFPETGHATDRDRVVAWANQIVRQLERTTPRVDLPLDLRATAFQRRVWDALRAIPRGETRTYAQIAQTVGAPRAARAVGRACATNPVALVVPCHRAIRGDGQLAGYRWGLACKRALLDRERRPGSTAGVSG
jgi:AraC family transcriptional regulator of adaptative response/methylated-DNA-[protein]-cysteine methyltransferase